MSVDTAHTTAARDRSARSEPARRDRYGPGAAVAAKVALAVVAIGATLWLTHVLFPKASSAGYAVLTAVFALVSRHVGRTAGFWAVGLTTAATAYFLLDGEGFAVANPADALGLVLFVSAGICVTALVSGLETRAEAAEERCDAFEARDDRRSALLAELSHRIGNDLGALVTISELQAAKAEHEETRRILNGIANRIYVLGKVYSRLRVITGGNATLDMARFLGGLCEDMRVTHLALSPISLETRIEPLQLPAAQSVLVGLVLNEAVTNALKYAFPDDRTGHIVVEFGHDPEDRNQLRLAVRDDGVGLGECQPKGTGMGQRLMRGMASQIRGAYDLSRDGGWTVARLRFPSAPLHEDDVAAPAARP